jgi:redox-sensitive bicupin YhaK (pirin superfamily)
MIAPRYQRIDAESIPTVKRGEANARVIAGELDGAQGPAQTLMPLFLWHVSVAPGGTFEAPVSGAFEVATYVISGEGDFGGESARAGELVVWETVEGAVGFANTGAEPLETLVLGGAPAEGPLVFHGPFVMNSVEQVRAAEIAYQTGRMGSVAEAA